MRLCAITGCEKLAPPQKGRLCGMHEMRRLRHGDPAVARDYSRRGAPLMERVWSKVDKDGPLPILRPDLGPCWLWTAGVNEGGYAVVNVEGRPSRVHRLVWIDAHGAPPLDRPELDHLCRVRRCVNPAHLEPVTTQENLRRGKVDRELEMALA